MVAVLGLASVLGFLICLVWTIVSLITKKPVKKSIIGLVSSLVVFVIAVAITPDPKQPVTNVAEKTSSSQSSVTPPVSESKVAIESSSSSPSESISSVPASSSQVTESKAEPVEDPKPEETKQAKETTAQKNALGSAKNYLSFMAFSYEGLVKQLEFEKYPTEDAIYAADNCGADWNEQAAKAAKNYLSIMSFSRDSLIEQLEFEGFTNEQAVYGVGQNGY